MRFIELNQYVGEDIVPFTLVGIHNLSLVKDFVYLLSKGLRLLLSIRLYYPEVVCSHV